MLALEGQYTATQFGLLLLTSLTCLVQPFNASNTHIALNVTPLGFIDIVGEGIQFTNLVTTFMFAEHFDSAYIPT